ncbi:hypothetical protein PAXRUDRAFT_160218, partial [Paxillus rubicundulus Ve08.2h10]
LAIHILSIMPNSAATERLFSQFGIIHSRLHNCLSIEKVWKQALVRADTITQYGCLHGVKRKFADIDSEDSDSVCQNTGATACHNTVPASTPGIPAPIPVPALVPAPVPKYLACPYPTLQVPTTSPCCRLILP